MWSVHDLSSRIPACYFQSLQDYSAWCLSSFYFPLRFLSLVVWSGSLLSSHPVALLFSRSSQTARRVSLSSSLNMPWWLLVVCHQVLQLCYSWDAGWLSWSLLYLASSHWPLKVCLLVRYQTSCLAEVYYVYLVHHQVYIARNLVSWKSVLEELLDTFRSWAKARNESHTVDVILVDFIKAFYSVRHQHLLVKSRGYGISGNFLNWLSDYHC